MLFRARSRQGSLIASGESQAAGCPPSHAVRERARDARRPGGMRPQNTCSASPTRQVVCKIIACLLAIRLPSNVALCCSHCSPTPT